MHSRAPNSASTALPSLTHTHSPSHPLPSPLTHPLSPSHPPPSPSLASTGPGVLEAQMGMLGVPWVRNNGGFNTVATGDIVPSLGSHSGTEQQIDCQGFPTIPFASCHLTIGAVFAKNCGFPPREPGHEWESLPVDPKTKAMNYCPGLISTQEGLPDSVQNSLARTRSNYFWGENAYLWNNSDFHLVGGRT